MSQEVPKAAAIGPGQNELSAAVLNGTGERRRIMGKKKMRGALSFLAVTCFLVGQVAAQEVASVREQGTGQEFLPEGVYHVRDGDTLWAIAGRYLDNPRLWPQIWKENPFVTNPDLIFPGDPLVIPGLAPPPKPVVEAPPVPPVAEERVAPPVAPPVEGPPVVEAPPAPAPPEVVEVVVPEEVVGLVAPPSDVIPRPALECSGYVADRREIRAVGEVVRPTEEGFIGLWYNDQVYLNLGGRKVEPGNRFWVIRPTKRVKHPATGRSVGMKVRTLGTVEIVSAAGRSPRGKIIYNCEEMAVGDALVDVKAWGSPPTGLSRPPDLRVGGYIVASKSDADVLGQGDIVYVDIGQEKGIIPGDEFSIYQMSLTPLKWGELVVLRTSAQSAVGLVTKSNHSLRVGHQVLLSRQRP